MPRPVQRAGGPVFVPPPSPTCRSPPSGTPAACARKGVPRPRAQLHLCRSMFRAYSIRCRSSSEQPDISRAVSRKVADSLSSLMYVRRYSSFWLQMIIFVWSW